MSHATLERGTVLKDKYRIEDRLGAGGMAVVYRARNIAVDRVVAIKVLNPQLASNEEAVQRFKREARAANQARHPNIVDVLDVDQDDDMLFIVQEYLEGEDFATKLKRERHLSVAETLAVMLPVARAVGAAHDKGIVHRDLKPENVFLAEEGGTLVPKVLDFGISKMPLTDFRSTGPGGAPVSLRGGRITVAGVAMGTPYYMSPEQIRDPGGVDRRTDVWSLGVMLYEALSGTMPFNAEDMGQLFAKIHTVEPVRLDKLEPSVPSAIAKVVHRCLRVEAASRYASAAVLASALERALDDIDDEPSVAGDEHPALAATQISGPGASAPGSSGAGRSRPGGSSPGALELDLVVPSSGGRTDPSLPVSSRPRAPTRSEPEPREPSAPRQSGGGFALELELPSPSGPAPRAPGSAPSAPSAAAAPASGGAGLFDEDDDDDAGMDLAVEPPSRATRGHEPSFKPRVAVGAERGPDSRRRIHLRQHTAAKLTGDYLRFILGGLVVGVLAYGSSFITPAGMAAARAALGGAALPTYGGAAAVVLVAFVVTASYGLRTIAYSLMLASVGLLGALVALLASMVAMFSPGLAPSYLVAGALFVGPFAVIGAVAGYALFAGLHGRERRQHDDERLLGNLLLLAAVLALGAGVWIVRKPRASLTSIQSMRPALAEPVEDAARELAIGFQGQAWVPAASSLPLRSNDEGARIVAPVVAPVSSTQP